MQTLEAMIAAEETNLQNYEEAKERTQQELQELEQAITELQEELKDLQEEYDEKTKAVEQAKKKASKSAKALDQVLKEIASKVRPISILSYSHSIWSTRTTRSKNWAWNDRAYIADVVSKRSNSLSSRVISRTSPWKR